MGIDLIADLITSESSLDILQVVWSWLGTLISWMGGVIVAVSGLGVVLYVSLRWEQRTE